MYECTMYYKAKSTLILKLIIKLMVYKKYINVKLYLESSLNGILDQCIRNWSAYVSSSFGESKAQ